MVIKPLINSSKLLLNFNDAIEYIVTQESCGNQPYHARKSLASPDLYAIPTVITYLTTDNTIRSKMNGKCLDVGTLYTCFDPSSPIYHFPYCNWTLPVDVRIKDFISCMVMNRLLKRVFILQISLVFKLVVINNLLRNGHKCFFKFLLFHGLEFPISN
jgi:hypothetical protein